MRDVQIVPITKNAWQYSERACEHVTNITGLQCGVRDSRPNTATCPTPKHRFNTSANEQEHTIVQDIILGQRALRFWLLRTDIFPDRYTVAKWQRRMHSHIYAWTHTQVHETAFKVPKNANLTSSAAQEAQARAEHLR